MHAECPTTWHCLRPPAPGTYRVLGPGTLAITPEGERRATGGIVLLSGSQGHVGWFLGPQAEVPDLGCSQLRLGPHRVLARSDGGWLLAVGATWRFPG